MTSEPVVFDLPAQQAHLGGPAAPFGGPADFVDLAGLDQPAAPFALHHQGHAASQTTAEGFRKQVQAEVLDLVQGLQQLTSLQVACLSSLSHSQPQLQQLQEQIMQLFSAMPQLQHCTICSRNYRPQSSSNPACSSSSSVHRSLGFNQQTSPGTLPALLPDSSRPAGFMGSRGSGASSSCEAVLTAVRPFPSSPVHMLNGTMWISAAQPLNPHSPGHQIPPTQQLGSFHIPSAVSNDVSEHDAMLPTTSSSSSGTGPSTASAGYGMEHLFLSLGRPSDPLTSSSVPQDHGQALVAAARGGARQLHLSLSWQPQHDAFGVDRFTSVSLPLGVSALLPYCHSLTLQCEKVGSRLKLQGIQTLPSRCFANLRRLALYGVLPEAPAEVALAAHQAAHQQQQQIQQQQLEVVEPMVDVFGVQDIVIEGPEEDEDWVVHHQQQQQHFVDQLNQQNQQQQQQQQQQQEDEDEELPELEVIPFLLPLEDIPCLEELIISAQHSSAVASKGPQPAEWHLDLESLPTGLKHLALADSTFKGIGQVTHRDGGWGGEPLLPSLQSLVLLHPRNLCIPGVFGGSPLTRLVLLGECGFLARCSVAHGRLEPELTCLCSEDPAVLAEVFPHLEVLEMAVHQPISSSHLFGFQQLAKLRKLTIAAPSQPERSSRGGGWGSGRGSNGAGNGCGLATSSSVLEQLVQLPQLRELEYNVTGVTSAAALAGVTALHGGVTRLQKLVFRVQKVGHWEGWREALGIPNGEMSGNGSSSGGFGSSSSSSGGGFGAAPGGGGGLLQPLPLPAFAPLPNIWVQPKQETDEMEELLRTGRGEKVHRMVHEAVERLIVMGPEAAGGGAGASASAGRIGDESRQLADVHVHVCVKHSGVFSHGGVQSGGLLGSSTRSTFCSWNY